MFIPFPIIIPFFQRIESKESIQARKAFEKHNNEVDAYKYQKEWEQHQWDNMDYSKTYFYIWCGVIRECYCKKGQLQPSDVCCFVDEGKLSQIYTRSLCKTREEAEEHLRKSKEPREELVIEPWRGTYRVFNKTTGRVVRVIK